MSSHNQSKTPQSVRNPLDYQPNSYTIKSEDDIVAGDEIISRVHLPHKGFKKYFKVRKRHTATTRAYGSNTDNYSNSDVAREKTLTNIKNGNIPDVYKHLINYIRYRQSLSS